MDTLLDMRTAIQRDLTVDGNSTFNSPTVIDGAINRAKRKIESLFRWPGLEDALSTSTIANQYYYDYPDNWRPDSIWKLVVNNIDYGDPLVFRDFLYEKENDNPSGLTYKWSNQWKRFFIDPVPTSNGNNNIQIFGLKASTDLTVDADRTIFSGSIPEVNEAIVLEAEAILKYKGNTQQVGQLLSNDAKAIVSVTWGKIKQEQSKFEKTLPYFDVPNFFGNYRTVERKIGNF